MYKVAIVDDDENMRTRLLSYIDNYKAEKNCQVRVSVFSSAVEFLKDYSAIYDIVLMDIDMPELNGLTAAKRLRHIDKNVVLMFVTNLAQYAIKGYEVDALDYIVKPLSYSKFSVKFGRAIERIPKKETNVLVIKNVEGVTTIKINELMFIEVQGHNVLYHTTSEIHRIRGTMKEVVEGISEPNFYLCNRCYFVNLNYVEKVTGNTVVVGNEEIQISRGKKKAFMDALAAFYNMNIKN